MTNANGYIKSFRKILNWEWFTDINTCHFFIYCLHRANYEPQHFMGKEIPRGSFVSSLKNMSEETGLTIKQVRKCLEKLKNTQNVASKGTNKYTIVSVVNYELYQDDTQQKGQAKGQTKGKQRATIKEYKEIKNINTNSINNKEFYKNQKLNELFHEYLDTRKKIKVPNTERAISLLVKKLSEFDDDTKIKMLENAIVNGWKSVYPLKDTSNSNLPF